MAVIYSEWVSRSEYQTAYESTFLIWGLHKNHCAETTKKIKRNIPKLNYISVFKYPLVVDARVQWFPSMLGTPLAQQIFSYSDPKHNGEHSLPLTITFPRIWSFDHSIEYISSDSKRIVLSNSIYRFAHRFPCHSSMSTKHFSVC